ncbi:MAG TPA: glycerol-3-phosphate dehydrogenase/oxidase [Kofleriaceae bacterium]|nr:glycerol-3-phosphate dehydrogenase/oxidase [Kofleriaceae bacterium]
MKPPYDIVVVGGGITGAGIARDAALRGMRVAMFEKSDYGSGTSSKSSKLIHGGLRYLEQGEIGLVFESVSERRVQCQVAPHLVRPLSFLLPIYEGDRVGVELMNIGLWIYDTLALFRTPGLHKTHRGGKAAELEPALRADGLRGAIEYYDCTTDDARLVLENVLDARAHGADCRNHHEVIGVERKRGRVSAVVVRDRESGREERVATHSLMVAAGPWSDQVAERLGLGIARPILRPTKGVHAVFRRELLPLERAVTVMSPLDGRVMFAIPWRERLVLGTTDTDFHGSPDEVSADASDVAYLCDSANRAFPRAGFSPDKVLSTWAGLRPLIHEEAETASEVSREHQIYVRDDGVSLIAGGKLTTYRLMAKEAVKASIRWLKDTDSDLFEDRPLVRPHTSTRPLPGAVGLDEPSTAAVRRLAAALVAEQGLEPSTADHLADVYGTRARELAHMMKVDPALAEPMQPDLPYVWAEVAFAVERDLARNVDDVLSRRVPLLLVGGEQGLDVAERSASMIGARLGWDRAVRDRELARFRNAVADTRRFHPAG